MNYWIGIDGGGSNLRIAIVDDDLNLITQAEIAQSANPNIIGRDAALNLIQTLMQQVMAEAGQATITGVGIGISGASAEHAEEWLRSVVSGILPNSLIVASSDIEIALVGAHGQRFGVLILAGTGSVAYGVNEKGHAVQTGGWGYLLGDEGSGYWIGMQALKTASLSVDGYWPKPSRLTELVFRELKIEKGRSIVDWLYKQQPNPVREVAKLARLVLENPDDWRSQAIIAQAVEHLEQLYIFTFLRLSMKRPPIAFAGGLLSEANPLSLALMAKLKLDSFPQSRYSPVIGAALLAKLNFSRK